MAYDSARGVTVLFGGTDQTSTPLGDTWEYGFDCNDNGIPDSDDITSSVSADCNANGIPDECDVETVLFYDGFDGDLSQWECWSGGGSYNCEITSADGLPPPCLLIDDYAAYGAAVFSKQTFHYVGVDLELSVDQKNDAPWSQRYTSMDLTKERSTSGHSSIVQLSVNSVEPALQCSIRYDDNGTERTESVLIALSAGGEGWHNGKIRIRRDGIVEFYLDGDLLHTSTNPVTPFYDGQVEFRLGVRKSLYDNALVVLIDDCNANGVPDDCELEDNDCNENAVPDDCDIADGTSADENGNGIPDECEGVPLDIKPGSCPNPLNRSSHGVLPVAVVGTADFDVTEIDVASVLISRADGIGGQVAPNEGPPGPHSTFEDVATPLAGEACECDDLSGDGIVDLSLKFRTDDVVEILQLNDLNPGDEVELVVTGLLLDGSDFTTAGDCILIVPQGSSNANVQSNVPGTFIEVAPPDLNVDASGFADFGRIYNPGTLTTLTAPAQANGLVLHGWLVDGVLQNTGQTTIQLTIIEDVTARAVYRYWRTRPTIGPTRRATSR
jgi:hypothetical protein